VPLVVGGLSGRGDGVYVATGEEGVVHIVGKDFVEALDQEPAHFHTKELHDGVLLSTTSKLLLRDAQGERALRKRGDGLWDFERGAVGARSRPRGVDRRLDGSRGAVAQDVKDLARYAWTSRAAACVDQFR
jgi:hypothetical protein